MAAAGHLALLGAISQLLGLQAASSDPQGAAVAVRFIGIVSIVFKCVMDKLDHTAVILPCTASQMCSERDGPCLN